MKTQYTPGPWHAGGITVYGGSGARLTVADTTCSGSMTRAEDEANVQLIAAAPDLLAACSAVAEDSRLVCNLETGENYYPITPEEMGAIRRASAKAKGTK